MFLQNLTSHRFYENIYTEESVWEKPTQPVYPPRATTRLPPGPPPGYQAIPQPEPAEKDVDAAFLPSDVAAVSLSDGNQYSNPPEQTPNYDAATPQSSEPGYPPPPNSSSPEENAPLYGAPSQVAREPSPRPGADPQPPQATPPSQYPQLYGYPPQAAPPHPAYPSQPDPLQPNYLAQSAPAPAAGGGFMSKLQSKVVNKVPGGTNTLLGVGGALLAGAVLEHGWDKHEERERRRRGW